MTFATLDADFEERVKEIDVFFTVLAAVENGELSVAQNGGSLLLSAGSPPTEWGKMLKGAAYLVLYNLVEAFVRRGFQEVFEAIKGDNLSGTELRTELVQQWIMQKNRKVSAFDGSPGVYMKIANKVVSEIMSKQHAVLNHKDLPFSGNLDAEVIRKVCVDHGITPQIDPLAKGGTALVAVVKKRNALSHGDESFSECGGQATIDDLLKAKTEVVLFMRSILRNIKEFANTKSYKASP